MLVLYLCLLDLPRKGKLFYSLWYVVEFFLFVVWTVCCLEFSFQTFETFNAENGYAAILEGFGKTEEYEPQNAFGSCTYGKEHLCKGENVERDAHGQDDGSCAE